jgi:1-phosphofructokinase family hexose kinase
VILTITANAALDRVIFIESFVPSTVMRSLRMIDCVGGKGSDSSVVLSTLGAEQCALGFIAGENGRILEQLLNRHRIPSDLVWVEGETRIAHVIVETAHHRHSHITTSGYVLTQADCSALAARLRQHTADATWAVIGGSLPQGAPLDLYATLIGILHESKVQVLIDCAGVPVQEALAAGPEIIKMNHHELAQTFGIGAPDIRGLAPQVRSLVIEKRLACMVITGGVEGILLVLPAETYLASGPVLQAVNGAGAGDAVSAALVWQLSQSSPWDEALRWAAAASGAVVLTEGTAECKIEDILHLRPLIQVETLLEK